MFLSTLNIGEWSLRDWTLKASEGIPKPSMKNKNHPNRLNTNSSAEHWLNTLPRMESHYCRQSTFKEYLEPIWDSKAHLYREYLESCKEDDLKPVSYFTFDGVYEKMNLEIFQPKKDQCDICCEYQVHNLDEETYNAHVLRKEEVRAEKSKDEKINDADVFTMDLQAVLLAPRLKASALFYKTKLAVHMQFHFVQYQK